MRSYCSVMEEYAKCPVFKRSECQITCKKHPFAGNRSTYKRIDGNRRLWRTDGCLRNSPWSNTDIPHELRTKQDEAHEPECSHVCSWYRCQNTWYHMVMQSRTIPFCNSFFEQSCTCFPCYQSAVWSGKCRVWSVECEVRSVECKVWSGECRVCKV